MTLRFRFGQVLQELTRTLASNSPFLANGYVFEAWHAQLRILSHQPLGSSCNWEIAQNNPLKTRLSTGDYAQDGNGGLTVEGQLTSIWQIRRCANDHRFFEIFDNASTKISVWTVDPTEKVAEWNFDIGAEDSPGCHFHAQVPWAARNFDVPRLPIPFVLPSDALEFLLGELFQLEWARRRASRGNADQAQRLKALLNWQLSQLEAAPGAGWLALKDAKPNAGQLLGD